MQFNTPINLPPGFTTPALTVPVNSLNQPGYGAVLRLQNCQGNFQIFISTTPQIPLSYHHDYHYYHRTGPASAPSHATWCDRLPVNNTNGVMEIYSTGNHVDIVLWHKDGIFKRLYHKEIQISIKTAPITYDEDGNAIAPPQVSMTVSPPEPLTEHTFTTRYQGQYKQAPTTLGGDTVQNDNNNIMDDNFEIKYETGLYDDDDDCGYYSLDDDHQATTTTTTTDTTTTQTHDPDFDDEDPFAEDGATTTTTKTTQQEQDKTHDSDFDDEDPFAEDPTDTNNNTSTPSSNSNSTPPPNHTMCQTCHEFIPNVNHPTHSTHCASRFFYCNPCQRPVPKTAGHTHCESCGAQTTYAYLHSHMELYHEMIKCECYDIEMSKHLALGFEEEDFSSNAHIFPYTKLQQHYNTCVCREERCQYCRNWFTIAQLKQHEAQCQRIERRCEYCDGTFTRRTINTHYAQDHHFDPMNLPDIKTWRDNHLYSDTSAESSMYRLPTATNNRQTGNNNNNNDYYGHEDELNAMILQQLALLGVTTGINDTDPELINDIRRQFLGV